MANALTRRIFIVLIAFLLAFSFTMGEMVAFPDANYAEAARKKRRKKKSTKKKSKKKDKKESKDELDDVIGEKKADDRIDVDSLRVKQDVKLKSRVGKKIDESINKLLKILEQFQAPETLRRLAEFYWKKSNRLNLDLMRDHQKKVEKWFEAGQKGDPPKEPDADVWHTYNHKAVEICRLVIERYPDFPGMDEIYFFMGYNLTEIGQASEAVDYYKKLVREHPNSGYVPDSWMAIGDYYFSNNNVYDAMPAYEEVLKYDVSKVFGYAKYKIGWCYFNLGKFKDAIATFKEVVAWSSEKSKGGRQQITLMEEALKDLVMAFAEDGSVDEAEKYFLRVGGKKYFRMMLVRLADIYTNQGKLDESITIFRRLIKEYPLHKDNPDFQLKIVEAYSNKNDKVNTTAEILNMVYYAKPAEESEWVKANIEKEEERVQEAWENAERMLIKTVVEYHKEALKIKNEKTWDKTQKLYELYIQYFKKSSKYYDVTFNYAELLYLRKNYKLAGKWYTIVAEMDSKGSHFEEASYTAILSYEKLVHAEIQVWIKDTKTRSRRKDKSYKLAKNKEMEAKEQAQKEKFTERSLSENVQGFVKACNIYIDNIPRSKYKVDIIYKVAIIYYAHNIFDRAVDRFQMIVNDYPTHRLAEYSANLVLDSLNMKQDWRKLNATVRAYLKNKRLVRRAIFRRDLKDLLEKSSFKKVETTESEKNWLGAADEYIAFSKEFRKSAFRDRALYNASVHYVTAGELEKSIAIQNQFLKEHKKSSYAEKILFNLGKNYEALAYYKEAADKYEKYTDKYPKGKDYSTALFNASVFHENLGNTDKAVAMKKKIAAKSKDKKEKDLIYFALGFTYLDANDDKSAEKQFKSYLKKREKDIDRPKFDNKTDELKSRGKIEGNVNYIYATHAALISLYREQERDEDREDAYDEILLLAKCDSKMGLDENARDVIAEATYYSFEEDMTAYLAYKLEIKRRLKRGKWNKKLAEKLKNKSDMAIKMQKKYETVVTLKSPRWSIAALYRIGMVYKYYSLALFNSEIPYWLTMDQEVIYVDAIQRKAEPVERKALVSFEKCLKTAFKLGVYNEYTEKARLELQGYVPDVYIPANEIKFKPGFESDSNYVAKFEEPEVPDIPEPRRIQTIPAENQAGSGQ